MIKKRDIKAASDAAETILRRMPILWGQALLPTPKGQREVTRMVAEKQKAVVDGMVAAQMQMMREAMRFWTAYNGLNFVFIVVSMLLISIFSTNVVAYFNPKGIQEICTLLKVAVFIPVLQAITIPLKQLVLGSNKQSKYVKITMIVTILSLLLIVIITPIYKVFGVLIALILTELLTALIFYFTIKNDLFVRSS